MHVGGGGGGGFDVDPEELRDAAGRIEDAVDRLGGRTLDRAAGATQLGHVELASAWDTLSTAVSDATDDLVYSSGAAADVLRTNAYVYEVADDEVDSRMSGGRVRSGQAVQP